MRFLRERQRGNNIVLSFGPYATPRRRYFVYYALYALLGAVFVGTFIFFVEVYDGAGRIYRVLSAVPFVKYKWIVWMVDNPLQVGIGAVILMFLLGRLAAISGILAFLFLGKHGRIIFTPDKVKVRKFGVFWRSCPRSKDIRFEMKVHPKASEQALTSRLKGERLDTPYMKTGIVLMRCGATKLIKIATIFDWKEFKFGHKAEQLAVTLQTLLNQTIEQPKKDKPPENKEFFGEKVDLE